MPARSAMSRPTWISPLALAPVVLCLLAGVTMWQVRVAESEQQDARERIASVERRLDSAPGPRPVLRKRLTRLRAVERGHAGRSDTLTWMLGGLVVPAAAIVLFASLRRREEEGGRARSDERRLQALVQHSTEMIIVIDRRGVIVTQTGDSTLGHRPGQLLRRPLERLVHEDDRNHLKAVLSGSVEGAMLEWRLKHLDGHFVHVETTVADMREDPDVQGIVLTTRDVTERKASEAQLRHRAFHDPLTQLPNRALFYDRIEHALHRAARENHLVAVCAIDLDDFKRVNDSLGHAAGDELLIQVAQRLRGCLRTGDTAARLGGDEFGLLLEGVGERSEPVQVAERMLAAMRQPFEVAGEELDVLPSIGVALAEPGDEVVEDLLRHADVAMYTAKRNGKGRFEIYDPAMAEAEEARVGADGEDDDEERERLTWFRRAEEQRAEILKLLENDDHINVLFQPLLDLRTARIAGFESLARFTAPTHRPPNVWFSQAHRVGLGPRLEAAALRKALSTPGRPAAAYLAVNVSPSTLDSPEVREALPDDLSHVTIEITENERAEIDRRSGEIRLLRFREVVDTVENEATQMPLSAAQRLNGKAEIGDFITDPLPPIDFGRIAAQTAKQVIVQKVRDAERQRQYAEFKDRISEIVNGLVKRVEFGNVVVDLGRAEAMLRRDELLPRESFRQGERVRAYIYDVRQETRGPQIFLSRTHPQFMAKLFAQEVPEIYDGIIEIKAVARDPGSRAKIAVLSHDSSIDPIGACVGMRGMRVQSVSNELGGERVDIIHFSPDPAQYVINSLAPAEVKSIVVDEELHAMDVIVDEAQLSQAIGRGGQNVRLASELTGWELNIMTEQAAGEKGAAEANSAKQMFIDQLGVEEDVAAILVREGFSTLDEVAYVPKNEMAEIEEFDEEIVEQLRSRARDVLLTKAIALEEKIDMAEPAKDLLEMEGMDEHTARLLASHGIVTMEDLAEQAVDELLEIEGIDEERAKQLIMTARAPWFANQAQH